MNTLNKPGAGFTLLELMISLTIMGLVLVLVFGAFRIGSRAWERGERDVEVRQRERVVLNLWKRQTASACPKEIHPKEEEPAFSMRGDSGAVEFVSCISALSPSRSGMVHVRYEVLEAEEGEGLALRLYEKDLIRLSWDRNPEKWEKADVHLLIPSAEKIAFSYLKPATDREAAPGWQEHWMPEEDPGLPLAVQIHYQRHGDSDPITVTARIQARQK